MVVTEEGLEPDSETEESSDNGRNGGRTYAGWHYSDDSEESEVNSNLGSINRRG